MMYLYGHGLSLFINHETSIWLRNLRGFFWFPLANRWLHFIKNSVCPYDVPVWPWPIPAYKSRDVHLVAQCPFGCARDQKQRLDPRKISKFYFNHVTMGSDLPDCVSAFCSAGCLMGLNKWSGHRRAVPFWPDCVWLICLQWSQLLLWRCVSPPLQPDDYWFHCTCVFHVLFVISVPSTTSVRLRWIQRNNYKIVEAMTKAQYSLHVSPPPPERCIIMRLCGRLQKPQNLFGRLSLQL